MGEIKLKYDIKTYIFVHSEDIINHCESVGNFDNFTNRTYVFLGSGNTDSLKKFDNIIIARDLPNNLEEYPKMCAYSGWYVLFKNNLITNDYVNLFEYDIITCNDFNNNWIISGKKKRN